VAGRVIVVGAGAAGIIAAWRAATLGADVFLLEKNYRIGIKILISGGGKCNITHDGQVEDLLRAFRPNEARFIRPACYRFTNQEILKMLTSRGLEVYTREDGRVFPTSGTAKDVVAILRDYLLEAGVQIRLKAPVQGLLVEEERVRGVVVDGDPEEAPAVVLSVGGSSYPGTGTTGDGWPWVRQLGHTIVPVKPALAPIVTHPEPPSGWAGVALRDCLLKARQGGKEIARWRGDLLFTHHGVSGPTVLGISREVAEKKSGGRVTLEVDLAPDLGFEGAGANLLTYCQSWPKKTLEGFLTPLAPERLLSAVLLQAGIDPARQSGQVDRKSRNRLIEVLKGWSIGEARHVPLEKGEVVAGGVSLDEVDPQTMGSNIVKGLYLCGEILDIAGPVGGYNLQAAFSTGYVAGTNAASNL
jgi:predicted Rossmann fold flavoprotein